MSDDTNAHAPPTKPPDKRAFPRYEVTAYVDYTGVEVLVYHRIENISLGGMCIQTTAVEPLHSIVDLVINFPDLDADLAVQGEVVWCNTEEPMDMGIRYLNLTEERKEILRKYLDALRKTERSGGTEPRGPG